LAKKRWLWVAAGAVASAALVGAPRVARAYKAWELSQRQSAILAAKKSLAAGADGVPELAPLVNEAAADAAGQEENDDAEIRQLVMAAEIGPRTPDAQKYLINLAAEEQAKWAGNAPVVPSASTPGTRAWENLGPLAARSEFNGTYYKGMDSGRPTAIAVHPGNPNLTFLATSGGGVWVGDLSGNYPTWQPITDNLGALAVGAIAIDPNFDTTTGQVTILLGLGDAFDQQSGVVVKGTYTPGDAAGIWNTPVVLGAGNHPADTFPSSPLNVRQIRIDPNNTSHIFVGTDDGLYTSVDAGASFQLVDLPNAAVAPEATLLTRESVWEIQYLGNDPGTLASSWLVSGVYACPTPAGARSPVRATRTRRTSTRATSGRAPTAARHGRRSARRADCPLR
jgi:hypothetical protein